MKNSSRTAAEQNMSRYNKCKDEIVYLLQLENTRKGPTIFVPILQGSSLCETLFYNNLYPLDFNSNQSYTFFGKEIESRLQYAYGKSFKEKSYKVTLLPRILNRPPTISVTPFTEAISEENYFEEDDYIDLLIEECCC